MAKQGLYANINARKKAGTSRPKNKSTITKKAYATMQAGFPKVKAKTGKQVMKGMTISGGQKRPTKKGAGLTAAGVRKFRKDNPGSKLQTAVTGTVKKGSKAAKRRKSYCARSAGQMKKFPKAAKNPNSRLRQARKRWKC
jgi:hypothetical protein|tara:strand:+ start:564 stop:983 length:420 start_codon:yes stop_codon:yes gene_type:complete